LKTLETAERYRKR